MKAIDQVRFDDSGPIEEDIRHPFQMHSYGSDKHQCAFVMYCLLRGEYIEHHRENPFLELTWPGLQNYTYRQLMMKHLLSIMWEVVEVRIEDLLTHPFFMSVLELVNFEDRMRSYSARHQEMDRHMEMNSNEVFAGLWSTRLPRNVVVACKIHLAKNNPRTFMGLWRARRNRRQHRDEDNVNVRRAMGTLQEQNFLFWESRFPAFFMYLFQRLLSYIPEEIVEGAVVRRPFLFQTEEFLGSEYFPASAEFYIHFCHVPIMQ